MDKLGHSVLIAMERHLMPSRELHVIDFRNFLDILFLKRMNLLEKCHEKNRSGGEAMCSPESRLGGGGWIRHGPAGAVPLEPNRSPVTAPVDLPACTSMSKPLCILPWRVPGSARHAQRGCPRRIPRGYMLRGRVPVITHYPNLAIKTSNVQDCLGLK